MTLEIGPMLATTSQVALLAGPQTGTPSEEFSILMDLGAPPSKESKPITIGSAAQVFETPEASKPKESSNALPPEASPAIAQADALVFALSSDVKPPRMLDKSRDAFTAARTEVDPAPVPISTSPKQPIAVPIAIRNATTEPPASPTREPARKLAAASPKGLDDTSENQNEADDRRDETIEEEPIASAIPAGSNVSNPASMEVLPPPAPFPESAAVRGETTLEDVKRPAGAQTRQAAAHMAATTGVDLSLDLEVAAKNFVSIAANAEEQVPESLPRSLSTPMPATVAEEPVDNQKHLSEAESSITVFSEVDFAHGETTKIAPSQITDESEIPTTTDDIVEHSTPTPFIKSMSDLPIATSPPTVLMDARGSDIDNVLDRQLDLVRNERWLGELAQDIANTSDNKDRLSFRLMPHQLGRLDIEVSRSQSGLSLTIRTESDSAQSILTAAQSRLTDELRSQGVKLADTQMLSGDSRHSQHNGGNARPISLIENFTTPIDLADLPEKEQRDGRYA